ncbi:MAG TPA: Rossmann-like and DUF2520 domain-containing protein [Longimicrobiales bacterium]|nr:Rossmann-like and DUF2520 domain-containing protein [Longimicrobiales bacterium]
MEHLHVIGPGRLGLALADALVEADAVRSLRICGRHPEPPSHPLFTQGVAEYTFGLAAPGREATVVLLTVPDTVLPELAHALAGHVPPRRGVPVLHTSGALSTDVLAPLHARGYSVGSFFPLQTVPHAVPGARLFDRAGIVVSGEPEAANAGRRLAHALAAVPLDVPVARRPLVHAASLLISNGIAGIVAAAEELLAKTGVDPTEARDALLRLGEGALDGIHRFGPVRGVTGPVADGDVEAVALHMRALPPDIQGLYREIGRSALLRRMAEEGVDPGTNDHFLELFELDD